MAKCNRCKKTITAGIRYSSKRGAICEDCLEKELIDATWKFGSELEDDDLCDEKVCYHDEDYVVIKEDGHWVKTDMYFELFT